MGAGSDGVLLPKDMVLADPQATATFIFSPLLLPVSHNAAATLSRDLLPYAVNHRQWGQRLGKAFSFGCKGQLFSNCGCA